MGHNISELRRYFAFNNYLMVMEYILFYGSGIMNTLIYCLASIALALLVNPLAAYALSRYSLPGQYKILLFLIATMAFPAVVTMIPNFLLLRDLGLLNTFAALLLPTMANGYSIFLLKGFFDSLPKELFEAADLDGANEWQKFWIITMNLSKPVLAVIALGAFNGAYANFMYAFIMCQDRDMWTLTVWLYQLQQFSSQGVVFASLMIAAVPTLTVFILCQKIILRGIVVPTEK
jgi:multiple sugar transport system permease protein